MTLTDLTVFVLIVWGVVYVTTGSALGAIIRVPIMRLNPPALFRVLLYCPKCQAFWIGLVLGLIVQYAPQVLWLGGELHGREWLELAPRPLALAFVAMGATAACAPLSAWATDAYVSELEALTLDVSPKDEPKAPT